LRPTSAAIFDQFQPEARRFFTRATLARPGAGGLQQGDGRAVIGRGKPYLCSFGFFVGTEEEFKRSGGDFCAE
jgi:hypothetical protein